MKNTFLAVLALAIFVSFFRLGSVTLFDVDEAVFSQATKEMVLNGEWITPTYNGVNRYDKPILFYWLMAVSYKIFGINEFGARFPSALAALLLALSVYFFVRKLSDGARALHASLPLVLSLYFLVYSHSAVTDMILALFITLSLFFFYLSLSDEGRPGRKSRYLYGFYFFSALAFLTKGLIGILFPFGIATISLLVTEGLRGVRKVFHGGGVALFLIVSLPWYLAEIAANGREFIDLFIIKHHFRRYTGVISGHRGAFWYYIPVLILGLFPWIAFLPAGIRKVFEKNRQRIAEKKLLVFCFVWFAFIFVFFSLSTTKLPNYILSAVPAASIIIAWGMPREDQPAGNEKNGIPYLKTGLIVASVLAFVLAAGFAFAKHYLVKFGIEDVNWTFPVSFVLASMGAVTLMASIRMKGYTGILSVLSVLFFMLLSLKALPIANDYLQGSLHKYSLYARDHLRDDDKLIAYGINYPSIVFYSGHFVISEGNKDNLLPLLRNGRRYIAITKVTKVKDLEDAGFRLLENDGRYALLER